MVASYSVKVDWSGNGDFVGTGETVTGRVLARTTVHTEYGRDSGRNLAPSGVGKASFVLNNRSRDYSPDNGSSPLTGLVGPGRLCDIAAVGPPASTSYGLFRGYLDDFDLDPGFSERSVSLSAIDALGRFTGLDVSVPLTRAIRTGDAVNKILDGLGWTGGRDIDAGVTTIEYFWLDEVDAMAALQDVVDSEGPPAILYVDPATGAIVFRDRHHRLTRSASLTSQATLRDSGAEPKHSDPFGYNAGFQDVVNDIVFDVDVRTVQPLQTVWESETPLQVPALGTATILVRLDDPVTNQFVVTWSERVGASVSLTGIGDIGGTTLLFTFTGGASAQIIDDITLRSQPIQVTSTVRVTASDATSISRYGQRSWDRGVPWAGRYDAAAIASLIIAQRATRTPSLVLTVKSGGKGTDYDTRLTQQLARDPSDRITVVEGQSGVNRDGFIERIEHDVDWNSLTHTTKFYVDTAGTDASSAPTMFRFGVAGQGFNQGKFAT